MQLVQKYTIFFHMNLLLAAISLKKVFLAPHILPGWHSAYHKMVLFGAFQGMGLSAVEIWRSLKLNRLILSFSESNHLCCFEVLRCCLEI